MGAFEISFTETETVQDPQVHSVAHTSSIKYVKDWSEAMKSLFVFPKIWSVLRNRIRDDDMALILLSAVQRVHFVVSLYGSCNADF